LLLQDIATISLQNETSKCQYLANSSLVVFRSDWAALIERMHDTHKLFVLLCSLQQKELKT